MNGSGHSAESKGEQVRYSTSKSGGREILDEFVSLCKAELECNDIHELTYISLYLTPLHEGSEIELVCPRGERIDHIRLGPEATGKARGRRGARMRKVYRSWSERRHELDDLQGKVERIRQSWGVDDRELAILLQFNMDDLAATAGLEIAQFSSEARARVRLMDEIVTLYKDNGVAMPFSDWLRSGSVMLNFAGESLFEQLLRHRDDAVNRLKDALQAAADYKLEFGAQWPLDKGFDLIVSDYNDMRPPIAW